MPDDGLPTKPLRSGASKPPPTRSEPAPGDRAGNWIIGQRLGGGGFGDIYEARHHATGERVALKLLQAHFTASPEMLARFDREIQVLTRLRHPNIVKVNDAGFDAAGRPFLCMELLVGQDLGTLLKTKQRLDPRHTLRIFEPLCDAIAFAHERGIVHRDLKPSNVFVCDPDDRVVLLDFGIAKLSDALAPELTASHQSLGTPGCMAPEQIQGGQVDARTDIYALGGLLFQLLTGRLAFHDPSDTMTQYLHLHARRPRASAFVAVPQSVDDAIVRAMAIQPSDRFGDVRALLEVVRSALRETLQRVQPSQREYAAVYVTIDDLSAGNELDEALIADLESVLPAVERSLSARGFALALDLGTSALFVAPITAGNAGPAVDAAVTAWDALANRNGRDARVSIGFAVHRGHATVIGERIEPCPLLRPESWGLPQALEGVWVTPPVEATVRKLR